MPGSNPWWHMPEAVWTAFAAGGGFARYLFLWLKSDGKRRFHWTQFMAAGIASGFTGTLAFKVALLVKPEWAEVAAGLGGFFGAQVMSLLFDVFRSYVRYKAAHLPPTGPDQGI